MLTFFGREPARWIGLIITAIAAILRILVGDELISPAQADAVNDAVQKVADVVLLLLPLIVTELVRPAVTSVVRPALPAGTRVEVITPEGEPNHTTTV